MSTHNICFRGEIRKILCGYPLLSVAMCKTICSVPSARIFRVNMVYICGPCCVIYNKIQ